MIEEVIKEAIQEAIEEAIEDAHITDFYQSQKENPCFIDPRETRKMIIEYHQMGLKYKKIDLLKPPIIEQDCFPCIVSTKESRKNWTIPCFADQSNIFVGDETLDSIYEPNEDFAVTISYEELELHHLCLLFKQLFVDCDRFENVKSLPADLSEFNKKFNFVSSNCSKCLENCLSEFEWVKIGQIAEFIKNFLGEPWISSIPLEW